jgi:tetratricopeptide (TPR) repeat protein
MYKIREPSFNADSAIITHFKAASDYMGYKNIPPEQFVNEIAYEMMWNNEMDRSFKLFDLNIRKYPESHQAYNGMGDYFMTNKDKGKAIKSFKKSLIPKEVSDTRKT